MRALKVNNGPINGILPAIVSNPSASCSLMILEFLLSHTPRYYKSNAFSLFVFAALGFLLSVFFLHIKQSDKIGL